MFELYIVGVGSGSEWELQWRPGHPHLYILLSVRLLHFCHIGVFILYKSFDVGSYTRLLFMGVVLIDNLQRNKAISSFGKEGNDY